jgi:hypothetical protein
MSRDATVRIVSGELATWLGDGIALPATVAAVGVWRPWARKNGNEWLDLIEHTGRVTRAQVEAALKDNPRAVELFMAANETASRTTQAERRRVLAALVANGFTEADADFDVLLLLEQTVERLTDPHIRLLLLIESHPPKGVVDSPNAYEVGVNDGRLAELWLEAAGVITPLRLGLEREGLIRDLHEGTYAAGNPFAQLGGGQWLVSDYGQRPINYYQALGGGPA